jgi:hypothetical protein
MAYCKSEEETLAAKSYNVLRFARATAGDKAPICSWTIFATTSVALSSSDLLLAIGISEYR